MKKSVIIVLVNPENKILLQLRDDKPWIAHPNCWGLIGGGVEEGETALEAIKREINEEINCAIEPTKELERFHLAEEDLILSIFLGKIDKKAEEIKLGEGQKVEFFDLGEIPGLRMPPILKNFLLENKEKILN